jgi:hypothetical protein
MVSRPRWTELEVNILKQHYGKVQIGVLVELLPRRDLNSIRQKASRLSLKGNLSIAKKRYTQTNETFFHSPTTRSSYWAGMIASDGCVFGGRMLQLFQSDRTVLERFAKEVNYLGPILHKNSPLSGRPNFYVNIYSHQMVEDLRRAFAITPAKSFTLEPPPLLSRPNSLAYLCGYIDGNGTICLSSKGRLSVGMVGSRRVLVWARGLLGGGSLVEKPLTTGRVVGKRSTWSLYWSGRSAMRVLGELDATENVSDLQLERKWNVYRRLAKQTTSELHGSAQQSGIRPVWPTSPSGAGPNRDECVVMAIGSA